MHAHRHLIELWLPLPQVDHVVGELKARAKMISTTEEIAQVRLLTWLWQNASDFTCGRESMHVAFPGAHRSPVPGPRLGLQTYRVWLQTKNKQKPAPSSYQVGTISANGEREIGELIARAMEKVGGWRGADGR